MVREAAREWLKCQQLINSQQGGNQTLFDNTVLELAKFEKENKLLKPNITNRPKKEVLNPEAISPPVLVSTLELLHKYSSALRFHKAELTRKERPKIAELINKHPPSGQTIKQFP